MASKRMCPALPLLFLWILVRDSEAQGYMGSGLDFARSIGNISSSVTCPANASRIFYGIMFDAGSTGTRIHVYTFIQKDPEGLPILDNEVFDSVKPGLSTYADMPEYAEKKGKCKDLGDFEKGEIVMARGLHQSIFKTADLVESSWNAVAGHTVRWLLKVAKNAVPCVEWKRTPLVLKATAGLRLLPPAKAHALLEEVQAVFDESPFYVPADSVGILNGTDEGILAWVTLNFLTGHLYPKTKQTVGILDLGGASTQITFLPKSKKTIESVSADYIARFDVFNNTYELYAHSYLGHGIKTARLAALGALASDGLKQKVFNTSCLPKQYKGEFTFGGLTYQVSGISEGKTGYKDCYQEMVKVVKGIIQQPYELKDSAIFYAFSYYFDHAVEASLIDKDQGGTVQVLDFKKKTKEVCNKISLYNPDIPFLCMDLAYITCLLKDGYGFMENTAIELTKKVNNVEASWALGAIINYFEHIRVF